MKIPVFNFAVLPGSGTGRQKFNSLFRFFVYLVLFGLVISGCSEKAEGSDSETTDGYYYKATLDGKKINFLTVKFQGGGNDNRWEHVVVGGYEHSLSKSKGKIPQALDFDIWNLGGNIGPGSYSTPAMPKMIVRYVVQKTDGLEGYNTLNGKDFFTVKIDAISKNGIKGTFEGTLRNKAGKALHVTAGSFNLPYDKLLNP